MIKIVSDGYEFCVEYSRKDRCVRCKNNLQDNPCHEKCPDLHAICEDTWSNGDHGLICTSAQKVTEEEKVYGPYNSNEVSHLLEMFIEYFGEEGWTRGRLKEIDSSAFDMPFGIYGRDELFSSIREVKPRHLTFTQIKSMHPDLEDVVLIKEEDND